MKTFPWIIVRQHRTVRDCWEIRCAELRKGYLRYWCNQVCTKNGGRVPWNVTAICGTFKISCLMGRHHMAGGSEYHFIGLVILFAAMVEYHPISAENLSRLHQFCPKVLPGIFLGYALHAGGNLDRRHLGRRHWMHLKSSGKDWM